MHLPALTLATLLASPLAASAAPRVVADLPPIASLAAQVMGDLGTPAVLIATGGDGHHHQLRPSEARLIANADLLIWIGPDMTPWLAASAEALAPAARLTLLEVPGLHLREGHDHEHDHDTPGHGQDAAHDHDTAHDHGDEHMHEDEHAHGDGHDDDRAQDQGHSHAIDPHAWLDPEHARLWLGVIAGVLADLDPDNGAAYRANAAAGRAAIDAAEAEARTLLADLPPRPIVIPHDSLGYFTEAMGLPPALALADLTDTAPSARALRQLRATIAASDARCQHPEPTSSPRVFASLDGLDLRAGGVLDMTGLQQNGGVVDAGLYPALLTGLARTIADCAGMD